MTHSSSRVRGFTLIELLVVIAIIGILSAIVLGNLLLARTRSTDATEKENMVSGRSEAELFFLANNNSYYRGTAASDVCDPAGAALNTKNKRPWSLLAVAGPPPTTTTSIYAYVLAAAKLAGVGTVTPGAAGTAVNAVCNRTATQWVAQVPLTGGGFYCVDSNGTGTTSPTTLVASAVDYSC